MRLFSENHIDVTTHYSLQKIRVVMFQLACLKSEWLRGDLTLLAFKGFSVSDVSKTMVRLRKIEAEEDKTRIEMRGVKEEAS